jgi:hypothetical protein
MSGNKKDGVLSEFRKFVYYALLPLLTALLVYTLYEHLPWLLTGFLAFSVITSIFAVLLSISHTPFTRRQFLYVLATPLFLTPLLLFTFPRTAIVIGLCVGIFSIEIAAVYSFERKDVRRLSSVMFLILGIIISQAFIPSNIIYKSADNPHGLLDPYPTVTVYGNVTNGFAGEKLVFTSPSHQNFTTNTGAGYPYQSQSYQVNLPNRMNYTVSSPNNKLCSPVLSLNADSDIFAFNLQC